jgi:hypothetical protein
VFSPFKSTAKNIELSLNTEHFLVSQISGVEDLPDADIGSGDRVISVALCTLGTG